MDSRAYFADIEAQVADMARTERDERHAAARYDRRDLVRIGGRLYDADLVPHPADVWEAGDEQ